MEIENSSLWREVNTIINSGSKNVHWMISATIHAVDKNSNVAVMKVLEFDRDRDYANRYTDVIVLKLAMFKGDYAYQVFPYRDNLEVTLTLTPIGESGRNDTQRGPRTERFTAILRNKENLVMTSPEMAVPSQEVMNRDGPYEVVMQLQTKAITYIEKQIVGTVFRDTTPQNALRAFYYNATQQALSTLKLSVQGVDMAEADNTATLDHIIIPQKTRLVDVAGYMQQVSCGVYNAGLGCYYTNSMWYIYPLFDTVRKKNAGKVITIINIPEKKLLGIERTYRVNGSNLVILATGNTQFRDNRKAKLLNEGTGVRFVDSDAMMDGFVETKDNLAVVQSNNVVSQVTLIAPRDGKHYAPMTEGTFTSNKCNELSKLAQRNGTLMSMTWQFADPTLLEPGMLVKLLYISNNAVNSVTASLLGAHEFTAVVGQGISTNRCMSSVILTLFVADPTQ